MACQDAKFLDPTVAIKIAVFYSPTLPKKSVNPAVSLETVEMTFYSYDGLPLGHAIRLIQLLPDPLQPLRSLLHLGLRRCLGHRRRGWRPRASCYVFRHV